jgi:hypothetical protein
MMMNLYYESVNERIVKEKVKWTTLKFYKTYQLSFLKW